MIRRMRLAVLVSVAFLGLAAGGAEGPPGVLRADVAEWSVIPSSGAVRAGRVEIDVRNLGEDAHRLTLVRTATFAPRLPLAGAVARVRPLAVSPVVAPGGTGTFQVVLAKGSYVLLDNLPWNYWHGMSVAFVAR
jgi:hypothetical protein